MGREHGFGNQPQSVNGHLKPNLMLALYLSHLLPLFIYHESEILPSSLGSDEGQHEKEEPKKEESTYPDPKSA